MFIAKDIEMKKTLTCLIILLVSLTSGFAQPDVTDGPPANAQVFTFVEQMPEFPGGDAELIKFLVQNIRYPKYELDHDIQGKVLVKFVVADDGSIRDVTVARGVSPGLDAEAVRVVKMLPKFKPGTQQGKPVSVYFNLPIVFKLAGPDPKQKKKGKKKKG